MNSEQDSPRDPVPFGASPCKELQKDWKSVHLIAGDTGYFLSLTTVKKATALDLRKLNRRLKIRARSLSNAVHGFAKRPLCFGRPLGARSDVPVGVP